MPSEPESGLDALSWPVRTTRLLLRRPQPEDGDAVFAYRSLEPVARWLTRVQTDREAWREEWQRRAPTTIIAEHDGQLIGDLRIVSEDAHAQLEIAALARGVQAELMWAFDPTAGGQGYATEAVHALVDIAFTGLGMRRLVAHCYAENRPSWRLMERIGMRRETHELASTLHRDGCWRDFFHYALLAPDAVTVTR